MKKLIIVIILVILVTIIAIMAPPLASKSNQTVAPISQGSPAPPPKPTPLVKIDKNSDLSIESKKLDVKDFQPDFDLLDKTISNL